MKKLNTQTQIDNLVYDVNDIDREISSINRRLAWRWEDVQDIKKQLKRHKWINIVLLSWLLISSLIGCCKEETETCATLVGYGGNASSNTLIATYSNGYTVQGTKDDLPFDTMICADIWVISKECKTRVVSKDKWSYVNEGTVYRFYTVNEEYVEASVYRNAVIGQCLDN